jgi:anaerobic selenocysteine-containing dehydrogenase
MCDDHCGINVYFDGTKIVDIDGIKDHYWNKGRLCVKGRAGVDLVYAPDRILKPLKKTQSGWQEIGLEQALDEIAQKTRDIQKIYGDGSMCVWKGEAIGFAQQEGLYRRFIHALGSPNYFSNDTLCYAGRHIGYSTVVGVFYQSDFANSKCILMWGSNAPHAHPNVTQKIMAARKNGAKLIVIDPRLSVIARKADIFAQLKPGTDGALAHGIIRRLIEMDACDEAFINQYTIGFEKLKAYAQPFTPEMVEQETGVSTNTLNRICDCIARNRPQVTGYVGNGLEHHENGVNNVRAVACIDGIIGSFDTKGGSLLPEPPNLNKLTLYQEMPLKHIAPIGADDYPALYDLRRECHSMMAMDTILSGKPYPLKGMILSGANPVLTNPNSAKVSQALGSLDLFVVRELFMTETAKLADYVLPAASYLERTELHSHAMHQVITLTERLLSLPEVQDEYQFLHDLAHRLGIGEYFCWENEEELNQWLVEPLGVPLEEIKAHPEGYRYQIKRYQKYRSEPFKTASGKLDFASAYLKDLGYTELPEYQSPAYLAEPKEAFPFTMITGARKLMYYHSRNFNIERFRTAVPAPEIEMHPLDAQELDVNQNDIVNVTSSIGSIQIPVKITSPNEILPGVVQITHGWQEANVNLITPDHITDPIDGFPAIKSVEVFIEKDA